MSEAREICCAKSSPRTHPELVLIGADDPMRCCGTPANAGGRVPFAADPSQQLARLDGRQARELIDGATYLFTK